ncbi:MAG: DUF1223 domain-containing protein [Arenicellales bacterium]
MRNQTILLSVLALICLPSLSMADKQYQSGEFKASVVELYTSEGCSSCPPADKFLSKLGKTAEADLIVPLAFHVDYWDYIGWKDPFSKAKYTQRQREVAAVNKQSTIYTPEFVVDGREARGTRRVSNQVLEAQASAAEADINLNLSAVQDGKLSVDIQVNNLNYQGNEQPEIYLALYENNLANDIDAGENRGRVLKHDYVVRYISMPESTSNGMAHHFDLQLEDDWDPSAMGVSAIVKLDKSGRTLQALKGML